MSDFAALNTNDTGILLVSQFEHSDIKDSQAYIKDQLIPSLDKNYQFIKAHIKGTSKKLVYNIRKSLIDLLDGQEEIGLIRYDCGDSIISIYESSYSMVECLNVIHFFVLIMRSKSPYMLNDNTLENTFKRLLKDIRLLQSEILEQLDSHKLS